MTFNPQDPEKLFIVESLSRKGICEELNDYLAAYTDSDEHNLDPTDPRLTDEFCQTYADFVSNLDPDWNENAQEEALDQMRFEALASIGAMPVEDATKTFEVEVQVTVTAIVMVDATTRSFAEEKAKKEAREAVEVNRHRLPMPTVDVDVLDD